MEAVHSITHIPQQQGVVASAAIISKILLTDK